jgi:hypothetical protein
MGEITYQDGVPLRLPLSQSATARISDHGVELIVFVSVDGKSPDALQVQFPMHEDDAAELAKRLMAAVEAKKRQTRR